jgi:copper transport protein
LALLPGLGGHAGVQNPVAVLLPANVVHVLAAGAWIGGVAALVGALPAATRRLEPADRTRLLAAALSRFSTLALIAVAALLAGGILQALLELGAVDDLWDTAFGRAITIKVALVVLLLGLGALNRRRTVPRLRRAAGEGAAPGAAGVLLRRTLRAELALGVAALGVTGALAGYAPAIAQTAGPFSGSADLGPARAELTVEPARAGSNEIHVYLFNRSDGRQYEAPKELRIEASLPDRAIEPIELEGRKAGPGHYVIGSAALSPPGDWRFELVARISDFDELRTTFTVPIE